MKYAKAAAVVAGSMMAIGAGAATPAFAAAPPAMPPMSLNGGLDQATQSLQTGAAVPVAALADTATSVVSGKADAPEKVMGLARQATPMLGGVQLGSQ